jgi:diguanylate cyclase (GGDEF)-like protein
MVQDITARKELEFQLQQLASSDTLTGLPNRRHGERFLEAELALCRRLGLPLGVCFFDVDHFKRVNDSFGHLVGDTVLKQVAEQAQASIRRSDLVCRWGGEFVIISPNSNRAQLLQVAEKVRQAVMALAGTPRVTVSLGWRLSGGRRRCRGAARRGRWRPLPGQDQGPQPGRVGPGGAHR